MTKARTDLLPPALRVRMLMALLVSLLPIAAAATARAQTITIGGGLSAGSVPRALAPLCASARRLDGWGVSARVGVSAGRLRLGGTMDYLTKYGAVDVADCVARSGVSVDSSFASAGRSVASLGVHGWLPLGSALRVGAEAGRLVNHASWFAGPALGAQYRRVGVETALRRHVTRFDEVTRNYGSGATYEISRTKRSEHSWGIVTRVMLFNRRNAF